MVLESPTVTILAIRARAPIIPSLEIRLRALNIEARDFESITSFILMEREVLQRESRTWRSTNIITEDKSLSAYDSEKYRMLNKLKRTAIVEGLLANSCLENKE